MIGLVENNQSPQSFINLLRHRWLQEAYVCVGLDTDIEKLPKILNEFDSEQRITTFNQKIADATHNYACAFKLNSAHYEKMGETGLRALRASISYIKQAYPAIPVILDAKRGDISETNTYYAQAVFDEMKADAVTVHPYMGRASLVPFLSRKDKGVIVMGANTAEGAEEIQSLKVQPSGEPLYRVICRHVAGSWNSNGNCIVTAGATNPGQLRDIRSVVGEMPILLLGVGAQGGDLKESVQFGAAKKTFGLIINSSRTIIYASTSNDFDRAAGYAAQDLNKSIILARQLF